MTIAQTLLATTLAILLGNAAAAAPETEEEAPAKRGGILTYMIPADAPPSFDGHREGTFATLQAMAPFYSVVIRINPENPSSTTDFVCDLCTTMPQPTDDGRTYTFKIRDGVKWHDGLPLTAADVAASWEHIIHPPGPVEALGSIAALIRRAVALDNGDAEARSWLSVVLLVWGDIRGALAESERALALSPNLAIGHGAKGCVLVWSGQPKEGLAALRKYVRLDPRDPSIGTFWSQFLAAHYFLREYEAAAEAAEQAVRFNPDFPLNRFWLPVALSQLGRSTEANEALQSAVAVGSRVFEVFVRQRMPFMRPEDYDHILDGLRKAGWSG